MTTIDVVFKNGVFKPLKKIEPKEGEIIEVNEVLYILTKRYVINKYGLNHYDAINQLKVEI